MGVTIEETSHDGLGWTESGHGDRVEGTGEGYIQHTPRLGWEGLKYGGAILRKGKVKLETRRSQGAIGFGAHEDKAEEAEERQERNEGGKVIIELRLEHSMAMAY